MQSLAPEVLWFRPNFLPGSESFISMTSNVPFIKPQSCDYFYTTLTFKNSQRPLSVVILGLTITLLHFEKAEQILFSRGTSAVGFTESLVAITPRMGKTAPLVK